jgi:anti-sigma-K factor RskA
MRYRDPEVRDALAAEYVLGTLHGRARARFRRLLRYDPALRNAVTEWEARLSPLALGAPEVAPPAQVWEKIRRHIQGDTRAPERGGLWQSLGLWRGAAALASVVAVVLALLHMQVPSTEPALMVVVMNDQKAQPRIAVSWLPEESGRRQLRIQVMGHQEMAPDTSWELWCLPGSDRPPLSLGLITTHEDQALEIPRHLWSALNDARGLAMSAEPKGGSPSGLPTGPVLYSGGRVRI